MNAQLDLLAPKTPSQCRFEKFHGEHPEVIREIRSIALKMKARGFRSYSIMTIYGAARYRLSLESGEDYKLNNNYMPYYSRLVMETTPELSGFFRTKELSQS